jgi:hypothetical protein
LALAAGCAAALAAGAKEPSPEERFPIRLIQGEKTEAARFFLEDYTLFRERRTEFRSTLKVYAYLFARLPLASDMIRALKIGKHKITEGPDGAYLIDTGSGVTGRFWIVHSGKGRKVIYGEGGYSGWLIRNLGGRASFAIAYTPARTDRGLVMKNHLMVFVKVDNVIVDFLIKSLDWMIRLLVRAQISQASSAAQKLTEAIAREPEKVYERLEKSLRIPTSALKAFRARFPGGRNKGLKNSD